MSFVCVAISKKGLFRFTRGGEVLKNPALRSARGSLEEVCLQRVTLSAKLALKVVEPLLSWAPATLLNYGQPLARNPASSNCIEPRCPAWMGERKFK
jgi:hypothetical protein